MSFRKQAIKYNILRLPDVKEMTGLCRSSIYSRIADGIFPKQFSLGGSRAVGWLESDIQDWIQQQVEASQ